MQLQKNIPFWLHRLVWIAASWSASHCLLAKLGLIQTGPSESNLDDDHLLLERYCALIVPSCFTRVYFCFFCLLFLFFPSSSLLSLLVILFFQPLFPGLQNPAFLSLFHCLWAYLVCGVSLSLGDPFFKSPPSEFWVLGLSLSFLSLSEKNTTPRLCPYAQFPSSGVYSIILTYAPSGQLKVMAHCFDSRCILCPSQAGVCSTICVRGILRSKTSESMSLISSETPETGQQYSLRCVCVSVITSKLLYG